VNWKHEPMIRHTANMAKSKWIVVMILLATIAAGCGSHEQVIPEKRPRPVAVNILTSQLPPDASLVSASVASWKTQEIGFEVAGRIEFVVEPNTEIEGRIADEDGDLIFEGTPIGRLESERYRLQVDGAQAEVARAEQILRAAKIELEASIPAQIAAANASRDLAQIEYDRSKRLFARDAGSLGDVDRDKANFKNAVSQLAQLDAAEKAKEAEVESQKSGLLQAQQNLRDAERNLEDCTLYSPFRGQIADVSVVPGSVVASGQAVATIQIMDPIKVELEVSAEDSRRLQQTGNLPVMVTQRDGSTAIHDGYLYLIDPVADPLTRTFTITLLVMNQKISEASDQQTTATTDQTWRLDFKFLPGAKEGMLFVGEKALLEDADGHYLWLVENVTAQSTVPKDRLLKVRKMRVELGLLKVPYLGNWVFQQVVVDDPKFDPSKNLVAGRVTVSEGTPEQWNGDTVLLDTGSQWMLRPGDIVKVDLSSENSTSGYFVPMDAIVRENNESFIFVATESETETIATRIPVRMASVSEPTATSGMRRIESVDGQALEGLHYVTKGAHYLVDGEPIKAILQSEVSQ